MKELRITPMGIEDLKNIQEIERLCFAVPWSKEAFEQELASNRLARYFSARYGDRVVAYAGIWLILDEGHITNIAVHPAYRRRGIAKKLLDEMIEYGLSRGIQSFTLEVRESNYEALKLYQDTGFVKAGVRKGYYSDTNENAIIMWLKP